MFQIQARIQAIQPIRCSPFPSSHLASISNTMSILANEAEVNRCCFNSRLDNMKLKLDLMDSQLDSMNPHLRVSHNPQSTSRDTNNDKDHKERGGEDRGTNEDPNVGVVNPVVVPYLNANKNDIESGQEEESSNPTIDTLEVLIVPIDCSNVEDGMPPFPIIPSDELQFEEFCFNIQSLTSSTMIKPSWTRTK
ncbi:hypothetical protein E5676_scaffold110G00910 [Cucumis melo var. makuwa]|uniref:Uncharacterized protein n=2 Tax=Cucumis melo TaxID=3656 RepID=A0A5D3BBS2_CUCMM|nr:hypothetical protein E6C27_scaffold20G00180 [Cucumis melo var. makuwa]TYJ95808.1 hypothetical protein E5676_scaffold110G00910 [Cucumis melo var. makuwa]